MIIEFVEFMDSSSSDSDNNLFCSCSSSLSSFDDEFESEKFTAFIDSIICMGERHLKGKLCVHCPTTADGGERLLIGAENIQHIDDPISATRIDCTSTSSSLVIETGGQRTKGSFATVVEDPINADDVSRTGEGEPHLPIQLNKESLRKTQRRRRTVPRPRAHGYSLQNASISSPSINSSVTRPYFERSAELKRSDSVTAPVRSSRYDKSKAPRIDEFMSQLIPKLENVRRQRNTIVHQMNRIEPDGSAVMPTTASHNQNDSQGHVLTDILSKRQDLEDDNNQSILDEHVSRVWSDEKLSMITERMSSILAEERNAYAPIRRSKSMAVHAPGLSKRNNKWLSDSGISGRSMDTTLRSTDLKFRPRSIDPSISVIPLKEKAQHQHPVQPPLLPAISSASVQFETDTFYTFSNEDLPYRLKLHSLKPTLRQFKEQLPKKGTFRYFFKTSFEDLDNPIVRQEIVNDDEILPLFEGKVKALIKLCE